MFIHKTPIRVLYAHTDKAGVVYYARYLEYFEAGRTEYLRALGRSYADLERRGLLLTVAEASCKYIAPAVYDDLLTICTWVGRLRRTRIDFEYEILGPTGAPVCRGSTVMACIDARTRRPCEVPADIKALLADKVARSIPEQPDKGS